MMEEVHALVVNARNSKADVRQRHEAFRQLVGRFQDMAYGCAYARLGDFHLAEDAAQEAFLTAYQSLHKLENPQSFPSWFRRVIIGQCDRLTRGKKFHVQALDHALEIPANDPDPMALLEQRESQDAIHQAIARLPDNQRDVISLFYIGEYSQQDIANFLDLPTNTVKKRLQHARTKLKERMIHMVKDSLRDNAPSRDDSFKDKVLRMIQPVQMKTETYRQGVDSLDGNDAWALMKACALGDMRAVTRLLNKDAKLVNAQFWYQFPIHMAVREGHADVVRYLLERGADPGQSRFTYNSWQKLLSTARERKYADVLRLLEEALHKRYNYTPDFEPVRQALLDHNLSAIETLLTKTPALVTASDELGNTALHWAVMTRQLRMVDLLLERGADMEVLRADGLSPLQLSIEHDYWYSHHVRKWMLMLQDKTVITGYLIAKGATYTLSVAAAVGDIEWVEACLKNDPGAASRLDPSRHSPLYYAGRGGYYNIVQVLLEHGADPNLSEDLAPDGRALFEASAGNHIQTAKVLLEAGANPNAEVDSSGCCLTIVEHKYPHDCKEMQNLLREYGAVTPIWMLQAEDLKQMLRDNPERAQDLEFVPYLINTADEELIDLLLDKAPDIFGQLHAGQQWTGGIAPESPAVLKMILSYGFQPDNPDWIGKTMLHIYAERGDIEAAGLVLEYGADINAIELESGGTPLALAVLGNQAEMVQFLLEKGADVNKPHGSSWAKPLTRALKEGNEVIVKVLEKNGATE